MAKSKNRRPAAGARAERVPAREGPPASCRRPAPEGKDHGFLMGLVYGLLPHTFCILFIVLSVLGATAATSLVKRFLYIPYIFQIIVALSFVFATVSAVFYLKRNGLLSKRGIAFKWKYLSVLYGTTVGINLLFFTVIFPLVATADFGPPPAVAAQAGQGAQEAGARVAGTGTQATSQGAVRLAVSIPCSGHAPLITSELKKVDGITGVRYQFPNTFQVTYDTSKLTVQRILALELFQEFPAKVKS